MEIELDCLRLNFCKNIDVFFFFKGAITMETHLLSIEGSCLFKVPPQGTFEK